MGKNSATRGKAAEILKSALVRAVGMMNGLLGKAVGMIPPPFRSGEIRGIFEKLVTPPSI
jgi:hypothetical protein